MLIYFLVRDRIAARREQLRNRRETLSLAKEQLADDISNQSDVEEEVADERSAAILSSVSFLFMSEFAGLDYWPFESTSSRLAPPSSPRYLPYFQSNSFRHPTCFLPFSMFPFPYLSRQRILDLRYLSQITKRSLRMLWRRR
jgi:hypothetical protein